MMDEVWVLDYWIKNLYLAYLKNPMIAIRVIIAVGVTRLAI